jgi:hypothetical protein
MLTTIPEGEHQAVLDRWRGSRALISRFHASLRRLLIELYRPEDKDGMLYLLAVGCQHITGPFYWDSAQITLTEEMDDVRGRVLYVRDENAGFELLCKGGVSLSYGTWEGVRSDLFGDGSE